MGLFIPKETLDALSYRSTLGRSLKQISLRATPLETILEDIAKYRASYIDTLVQENLIGSRFKSDDSIIRKYEKTLRTNGVLNSASTMCLVFACALKNTLRSFRTISGS